MATAPLFLIQSSGSEKNLTEDGKLAAAHSAAPGLISHAATSSIRGCWATRMRARMAPRRPRPKSASLRRGWEVMLGGDF